MTNAIKGIVSKKKKRYKEGGYDLDLTCKYMISFLRNSARGYPLHSFLKRVSGFIENFIFCWESPRN